MSFDLKKKIIKKLQNRGNESENIELKRIGHKRMSQCVNFRKEKIMWVSV